MPIKLDNAVTIFPFITTAQKNALTASLGMIVYDTDENKYYYWNSALWVAL
jgi:hypothetical protein